jgi:hypothetical protein
VTRLAVGVLAVLAAAAVPAVAWAPPGTSLCGTALVLSDGGTVRNPALREISGIDGGIANPAVWWAHNDSGDSARVFAIDGRGQTLGTFALAGITATDWEDISLGPGPEPGVPYIYVGDIGDNASTRPEIRIQRVREPRITGRSVTTLADVDTLHLRYPDGPRDAEALVVDPRARALFVIEKRRDGRAAGVYRAPLDVPDGSRTTLRKVGRLSLGAGIANAVTGADLTPDGSRLAVRTYGAVLLWQRTRGRTVVATLAGRGCAGPIPFELQGEAIGFRSDGTGYATIAEGSGQTLHLVAVREP